jgi:hypothetical protein
MNDLNRVTLVGRDKDPEPYQFESGDLKVSFSVATSERWTDKSGEKQERTQWANVVVLDPFLAKVALDKVSKGDKILVEGALEDLVENGDTVWGRSTCTGTDPRSGKSISIPVIDICRFENGKLVEHWGVPDRFALLHQIGALPPPPKQ